MYWRHSPRQFIMVPPPLWGTANPHDRGGRAPVRVTKVKRKSDGVKYAINIGGDTGGYEGTCCGPEYAWCPFSAVPASLSVTLRSRSRDRRTAPDRFRRAAPPVAGAAPCSLPNATQPGLRRDTAGRCPGALDLCGRCPAARMIDQGEGAGGRKARIICARRLKSFEPGSREGQMPPAGT